MALSRYIPISFDDDRDFWRSRSYFPEQQWINPQLNNRWALDRPAPLTLDRSAPLTLERPAPLTLERPALTPRYTTDIVPYSNQRLDRLDNFDHELRNISTNMNRMYTDMLTLVPAKALPTDIRMNEELRMDNPIITDNHGRKKFQLQFDVAQFRPDEISLTTADNVLTVHARHEEKSQGKSAFREYKRQYTIPKEVSSEALTSKLSHNGILSIEAPVHLEDTMIPIKHN